jgi:hypothetical protein
MSKESPDAKTPPLEVAKEDAANPMTEEEIDDLNNGDGHGFDRWLDEIKVVAKSGKHPPFDKCPRNECSVCAVRDCPYEFFDHYSRFGCDICPKTNPKTKKD